MMNSKEFRAFKATIEKASKDNDIWWCGYFFLACNSRQLEILRPTLREKFGETDGQILLPSGLTVTYRTEVGTL